MSDYIITNGQTLGDARIDIEIRDGVVDRIVPAGDGAPGEFDATDRFDAGGGLVTPPLVEPHIHLDATLTAGDPDWNQSGTLAEGISLWSEYKEDLEYEDVQERALRVVKWLVAHGVTRVRTHADTTEETLTAIEALVDLSEDVSDIVDLQVCAFPQDGVFTDDTHEALLTEAMSMGVDVVGGIPHNEHTREDGVRDVRTAMDLAERHDLRVDLHIDETDDPGSRFTEVLASEAIKREYGSMTTASHATAMHSYDNAYAAKVVRLIADAGMSVITNPPDNSVLQGRYDAYPRRRGHTRIDELRAAGVDVAIGHDSVVDPWYHYGVGDPLHAANVLIHYAHLSGYGDVEAIWEMLTTGAATAFGATDYGLSEGSPGSIVVYDASNGFEALRTQAPRTLVVRGGKIVSQTETATTTVHRDGDSESISFRR